MSKTIEAQIECPFYLHEGNAYITCEGINTKKHKMPFGSDLEKERYEREVCSVNCGKKCWYHKMVMGAKYKEV